MSAEEMNGELVTMKRRTLINVIFRTDGWKIYC